MGRHKQESFRCIACDDVLPLALFPRIKKERLCFRCFNIWKRYRVSHYDVELMLLEQDYKCAVCGRDINNKTLNIDHCHDSSKVRGLLCGQCNRGLGQFKDNIESFKKAIQYLRKHGKSNTKKSKTVT